MLTFMLTFYVDIYVDVVCDVYPIQLTFISDVLFQGRLSRLSSSIGSLSPAKGKLEEKRPIERFWIEKKLR